MREEFYATYPEGHAHAGQEITQQATCECGAAFTQRIFSERFLAIVEHARALDALQHQMPGLWSPAKCPHCERIAIRLLERQTLYGRAS